MAARIVRRLGAALVADAGDALMSQAAADAVEQSLERSGGPGADPEAAALRLLAAIGEATPGASTERRSAKADRGAMLAVAVCVVDHVVIASTGDCRCYRLRARRLELLTPSEHAGSTAYGAPRGQAHGGPPITLLVERLEPDETLLLCSSGLWRSVPADVVADVLGMARDAYQACDRLLGAAWSRTSGDDIAVAVARSVAQRAWLDPPRLELVQPTDLEQSPPGAT